WRHCRTTRRQKRSLAPSRCWGVDMVVTSFAEDYTMTVKNALGRTETAIRPYDLRHSSATLLLLAGENAKVVAERLGHSTTRLTQDTYQHVLPGMQEQAAAKLDAIFRQVKKAK
ncbi:MAG: tyrosine-type recombinase/integrase, partial [Planctomycetia bacterium]|nr:tyrosine-type recombinase/integrase [Planctomycetia bacterium]